MFKLRRTSGDSFLPLVFNCLKYRRPEASEVCFDTLEIGDGFVEAGELLFEFGDDATLHVNVRQRNLVRLQGTLLAPRRRPTAPVICRACLLPKGLTRYEAMFFIDI